MPVSQGRISSGPFGLTLLAWGVINGTSGALIANQGVASTARSSVGIYTFTLSTATVATAIVIARNSSSGSTGNCLVNGAMTSATTGRIDSIQNSPATDTYFDSVAVHFEVWA